MTSPTHAIRLRGPWQYVAVACSRVGPDGQASEEDTDLPAPGKLQMPSDWSDTLGAAFRGRVNYERQFNRPTGLQPGDQVDLVIDRVDAFGRVWLNSVLLGEVPPGGQPARFAVREHLQLHNRIVVEVCLPALAPMDEPLPRPGRESLAGGLVGEVRLEILTAPRDQDPT